MNQNIKKAQKAFAFAFASTFLGIILCVLFTDYALYFMGLAFIIMATCGVIIFNNNRCPKCKTSLMVGGNTIMLGMKFCPHCGGDLKS